MRGVVVAALALGLAQAPSPAPPSNPVVRVDAVITDARGRPIMDLSPDDFAIVEDGVLEKVESAALHRAAPAAGAVVPIASREDERAAAQNDARLVAIYLDEYHVAAEESESTRRFITDFIQQHLGPRDLAIVVKPLDSLTSLRMTQNREGLLEAVRTFEGRKGNYEPVNAFERNYMAPDPARNEGMRAQIALSALNALATHLGGLGDGRKTLIVVSEGFGRPPRRRDAALPTIETVTRAANRALTSIYAIDPRAIVGGVAGAPGSSDASQEERDALRHLGGDTDGRAMLVPSDVAPGIARLVSDAAAYYTLTFHPAHPTETRTFHPIDIRVRRPTAAVHGRPGYWLIPPEEQMRRSPLLTARATPAEPMRHASPLIRPWFGIERGDAGQMRIHFVWEAAPVVPGERARPVPSLVVVKATKSPDGALVFAGSVSSAPRTPESSSDVPSEVVFDAPPGRLLVQLQIQDVDTHVLDTDVRDVLVGGLTGPIEVGTAEVVRARTAVEYRSVDSSVDAIPSASRDFSRRDRLLIRVPVYGSDPSLAVTAHLTNRSGQPMRDLPIAPLSGTTVYQVDLPLAAFAAGEYGVQVDAKASTGDARENVSFRVTN
jgi:VWFA-related protein